MDPNQNQLSRRTLLQLMTAAAVTRAAAHFGLSSARAATPLVVGAAYVGPKDDYG